MIIRIGKADDNDYIIDDAFVSRYHARLVRDMKGVLFVEDLNSTNGTFVNGNRVMKKKISTTDNVQLGSQYQLNITEALKFDNDYCDEFALLKSVYNDYSKEKIRIQSSNQFKTRLFQSLPFAVLGVAGLAISFFNKGTGNKGILIISGILAICAPTIGIYFGARQSAKIPELLQNLANKFKIDYVCPKCGAFLGEVPWESLANKKQCPVATCKAKWVRK
jgi:lipopolysaccharide export LptBFGC system permease protein LptF